MRLSKRLDLFGNEVFAALNLRRRELEAKGREVFDLSVGTPDFAPDQRLIDAMVKSAANPENWKYSLHDRDELDQAVCDYYRRRYGVGNITPGMVMSCHGTQEGMGFVCQALVDPGDTVYIIYKNMPLLQIIWNFPLLFLGFSCKALFFVRKGFGREYLAGIKNGISLSRENQDKKVSGIKPGRYMAIQWELYKNIIRFLRK